MVNPHPLVTRIRKALMVITALICLLLFGAVLLLIQSRSGYYASVSVKLAVGYAEQVLVELAKHQALHQSLPANLSELQLPKGEPGYVPKLTFDAASGGLAVEVHSDHGNYGSFRYVVTQSNEGAIRWRCENLSVESNFLPLTCAVPASDK